MVEHQLICCSLQPIQRHRILQREHHRLIPMVRLGEMLFEEPVGDWSQRRLPEYQALLSLNVNSSLGCPRQIGDVLVLEDLPRREVDSPLFSSGDDLYAENGITAEFKEIVIRAHPIESQHFLPDLA